MNVDIQIILLYGTAALAGIVAGRMHFASLARVTDLMLAGRLSAIALQLGRFMLLGAFLWLFAQAGPAALLTAAGGVLAGRSMYLQGTG